MLILYIYGEWIREAFHFLIEVDIVKTFWYFTDSDVSASVQVLFTVNEAI